jgi:HAD superfamily phosphoserine phosphatase-like hydrolase
LRLTRGWDQEHIRALVADTLADVIEPIVFEEALELIREHQRAGRKVFIISASPQEIVEPLGGYLGVDGAIGTRAKIDAEGRYTGEVDFYSYGPYKAEAILEAANWEGIDLTRSYAYSDSITDLPMLEVVGHPVVVNPDRDLARIARDREWEVRQFRIGVPLRERVSMPPPRLTAAVAATAVGAAAGAGALWWWLRKPPAAPPPSRVARARGRLVRSPAASSPQRQRARARR